MTQCASHLRSQDLLAGCEAWCGQIIVNLSQRDHTGVVARRATSHLEGHNMHKLDEESLSIIRYSRTFDCGYTVRQVLLREELPIT
jgi:hypothetical protein